MDASKVLVERGSIKVAERNGRKYVYLVVYTSSILEVDALVMQFGGCVYEHSEYIRRWEIWKVSGLLNAAVALQIHTPQLASMLIRYCSAQRGQDAWAIAIEIARMYGLSIRIKEIH